MICDTCDKPFTENQQIVRFVIRYDIDSDYPFKEIFVCNSKCSYDFLFSHKVSEKYPKAVKISEDRIIHI